MTFFTLNLCCCIRVLISFPDSTSLWYKDLDPGERNFRKDKLLHAPWMTTLGPKNISVTQPVWGMRIWIRGHDNNADTYYWTLMRMRWMMMTKKMMKSWRMTRRTEVSSTVSPAVSNLIQGVSLSLLNNYTPVIIYHIMTNRIRAIKGKKWTRLRIRVTGPGSHNKDKNLHPNWTKILIE